ncbi:glycosyltransferase [Candidatus Dependentiae bacterium]|nr:glycosyltransferase [Candidatus Dependentiae bacterium]
MKRYKIAHLQVLPIMSGVQKAMVDLISRLDKEKYIVTVICQSKGELTEVLESMHIPVILVPSLKREINLFYDFKALITLVKIFRKNRFDIVHTHSSKPGFLGRIAGKIANIGHVIHTVQGFAFHEFSNKLSVLIFTMLEKIAGKLSDKIIIVNDQDFQYAVEKRIAPLERLVKIGNGIDINEYKLKFNIDEKRDELHIYNQKRVIGSVGRLWQQKDPKVFVNAMPRVIKKFPNTCFLLIGDGPLQSELQSLTRKLNIERHVKFLGWRKDVNEILQVMDIFVQTSLWEGLSISILEAMASGKPVITTNVKGNNELVIDGDNGFLIKPGDAEMLAERIITLLENKELSLYFGKRNREKICKDYNIDFTVNKIEELYQTQKFN